jgi:trehalose/maltose hydrolase-like predicted phosphorylase
MRPCTAFFLASTIACGCSQEAAKPEPAPLTYPWEGAFANWQTDIVIEGPAEDQQAVRSFIYYLRRNVDAENLSPFGTTNDLYAGRYFWDMDVWVFPALALIAPEQAKAIPQARIRTAKRAQIETLRSLGQRQPAELLERVWKDVVIRSLPLRFPWESDESGRDVSPPHTKEEIHVSGDVAWGLRLASDLGLADAQNVDDIGKAVAEYYLARSVRNPEGLRELRDVVSVDEWITGDNCLYTNAVAQWTIESFLEQDVRFYFPHDGKGNLVAYDGDPVRAYQQAAAPLVLWPLEREDLVTDPVAFLDRFEGKESPNGPAMSLSVYALVRARYSDADQALQTWRESWRKYTDAGLQFSERPGRSDLTYFNTGAAGCLNAVVYGFLGARVVSEPRDDDAKIALKNGRWLVFRPNLPSEWKKATFKGMTVLGKTYDVVCVGRTATVTAH